MIYITLLSNVSYDLTGDGIDDEVKVGEKSIVITNGATGKKYFPVKGEGIVDYMIVDNFLLAITEAFKIYIYIYNPQTDDFVFNEKKIDIPTDDYANFRFSSVQERCEGYSLVFVNMMDDVPTYVLTQTLNFEKVEPIAYSETFSVSAGSTRYINPLLKSNEGLYFSAVVHDKDIYLYIEAGDCGKFDIGRTTGFVGYFLNSYGHDERININFDNSYSIFTSKTITYSLFKFPNPYIVKEKTKK